MTLWAAAVAGDKKLSSAYAPRATSGWTTPVFCALLTQLVAQILALFGTELVRMALHIWVFLIPHRRALLANERTQPIAVRLRNRFDRMGSLRSAALWRMRAPAPWLRRSTGAKPCSNEHPY